MRIGRRIHLVTLVLALLLIGAGVFGWWYLTIGRWPLAGTFSVNFGEVGLTGQVTTLEHVFELRNRTDRPLVIQGIRASCGCTPIDGSGRIVEAGEVMRLPVKFNLSEVGPKNASLSIIHEDDRVQTLWLRAIGRRSLALQVVDRAVDVGPEREGVIAVMARVQDHDDAPPPLELDVPPGIDVEVGEWTQAAPRQPRRRVPALWRANIRVTTADSDLSRQGVPLLISLPGTEAWRVLVRGEPVRTERPPMDFPDDL